MRYNIRLSKCQPILFFPRNFVPCAGGMYFGAPLPARLWIPLLSFKEMRPEFLSDALNWRIQSAVLVVLMRKSCFISHWKRGPANSKNLFDAAVSSWIGLILNPCLNLWVSQWTAPFLDILAFILCNSISSLNIHIFKHNTSEAIRWRNDGIVRTLVSVENMVMI